MQPHKLSIACVLILFLSIPAPSKILFVSSRDIKSEIYMMNDDGSQVRRLTNDLLYNGTPRWSPDGRTITFHTDLHSAGGGKGQQYDLFIMNADGSNQRNLTQHPALDIKPSWSPDGHRLAFVSTRTRNRWEIFMMDIASGKVEQLTDSTKVDGYATSPSWSPDGKHIAYELAMAGKGRDIYIMNADGKHARPLSNRKEQLVGNNNLILRYVPRWSPDGKRILYIETEHGPDFRPVSDKLVIRRSDGSNPQSLPIPKGWLINKGCWAADGTEILFTAKKPGGNYEIYRYNRFSGEITNLTNHPRNDYVSDWLSDNLSVASVEKLSILWGAIKQENSRE